MKSTHEPTEPDLHLGAPIRPAAQAQPDGSMRTCSAQIAHNSASTASSCGASRTAMYARRARLRQSLRSTERVSLLAVFCMVLAHLLGSDLMDASALLILFICTARIVVLRWALAPLEA